MHVGPVAGRKGDRFGQIVLQFDFDAGHKKRWVAGLKEVVGGEVRQIVRKLPDQRFHDGLHCVWHDRIYNLGVYLWSVMWRLKLTNLTHSYGRHPVFPPIHFDADVSRLGISGPNGAGKSTLMSILAGLIEPSHGSVFWAENSHPVSMTDLRARIGFAGPYLGLYTELTVRENLRFICDLHGLDAACIDSVAEQLEIMTALDQRVGACSSGQQQRVRLATSIIHQPKVLFLDEPGTNLDESGLAIVASIVSDWPGPVVIASNQPTELEWCHETLYVGLET